MVTIQVELPLEVDASELERGLAELGLLDASEPGEHDGWLVVQGELGTQRQVARALAMVQGWAAERRLGSVRIRVAGLRPNRAG